jgi:hypothetical protein
MKRLEKQGHAERLARRIYIVQAPKKAVKAARAR